MSNPDASNPADRVAFATILDGGADPGCRLPGLCVTLANCSVMAPDQVWALLHFSTSQTFSACAARAAA